MTALQEKYAKVKKLSEQGATAGERQAAQEALLRLEQKYPELLKDEKPTGGYVHSRTWFSTDFGVSMTFNFQMWQKNPDGTWTRLS